MTRFGAAVLVLALCGCATERAAARPGADWTGGPVDLETYRGAEGFGNARWGMRFDEIQALVPNSSAVAPDVLLVNDTVEGKMAEVAYIFYQGKLARVVARFTASNTSKDYDGLKGALEKTLGSPAQSQDPRGPDAGQIAAGVAAAVAVGALAIGLALLLSGHGGGGGPHVKAPALPAGKVHVAAPVGTAVVTPRVSPPAVGVAVGIDPDAIAWAIEAAQAGQRSAEEPIPSNDKAVAFSRWNTPESDVALVARLEGAPDLYLSYDSRAIAHIARAATP